MYFRIVFLGNIVVKYIFQKRSSMFRYILFVIVAGPAFLLWAAYHAFIKKDFDTIKSDFEIGIAFFIFSGIVFYLLSLI
jgi:hypothetical protein